MTREEIIADLAAARQEMSLVREAEQPAATRPPPAPTFTPEEIARSRENPWVKINGLLSNQTPVL